MKKVFIILSFMLVVATLVVYSNTCFLKYEEHLKVAKNPYVSKLIDLNKEHVYVLEINNKDWTYNDGPAKIFLTFDKTQDLQEDDLWRKEYALKAKINAYAVTENNVKDNRLVLNYFSPTNEPMAKTNKLWSGWGDEHMEYFLGNVLRYPKEDLFIELTVLKPDNILSNANPRLKIIGDYDQAVLGYIPFIRTVRYGGFVISIVAAAFLMAKALRNF